MSKPSIPSIELIKDESRPETILRLAITYILTHCPDQHIMDPDYTDEEAMINGMTLAEEIANAAEELREERKLRDQSMIFDGNIIQAGGDNQTPTVTLSTSQNALKHCERIPFYQPATITITPI